MVRETKVQIGNPGLTLTKCATWILPHESVVNGPTSLSRHAESLPPMAISF